MVVNFPLLVSERSINLDGINKVDYEQTSLVERFLHFGTLKISTHEKNVMVLENMEMKSALDVFKDNTGSVYVFKDVEITNKDLAEINELISDAPKLGHKSEENLVEFNDELKDEIDGED